MELSEFIVWIVSGGGAIILVSFLFERIKFFQNLESETKRLCMFGSCVLISVCGFAIQQFVPTNILEQMAPYFMIISSTFYSLFISQQFHKTDKSVNAEK